MLGATVIRIATRTPVSKIAKLMKRTEGSVRRKALKLGIGLGQSEINRTQTCECAVWLTSISDHLTGIREPVTPQKTDDWGRLTSSETTRELGRRFLNKVGPRHSMTARVTRLKPC